MTTQAPEAEPPCPATSPAEDTASRPERHLIAVRRPFDRIPQPIWDGLAARSAWVTPFANWAFHRAWWDSFGATAHEQTLVIVDPEAPASAPPVAIVPLMHRHEVEPTDAVAHTTLRHGSEKPLTPVEPTAKAIFFGASYHADYATILAAPEDLPAVADAVVDHLATPPDAVDHPAPWDVVDLRRLRCGDPAADALFEAFERRAGAQRWQLYREREDVCPVLTVPAEIDFEGYLGMLDKKERHEIRRKIRRAEAAGPVELVEVADPFPHINEFIDLHQKRWGAEGLFPPTEGGAASRRFFRCLFELFGADGPLRLSFLTVGGRRIAAGVHFDDGHSVLYYNAGVDPDARDLSPGVVMTALYIKRAIETGRRRIDFLRGDEPYKYEWGAVDEPIQRILVCRTGS